MNWLLKLFKREIKDPWIYGKTNDIPGTRSRKHRVTGEVQIRLHIAGSPPERTEDYYHRMHEDHWHTFKSDETT